MDKEVVAIVDKLQELKDRDASFSEVCLCAKELYQILLIKKDNLDKIHSTRSVSVILPAQLQSCSVALKDTDVSSTHADDEKKEEIQEEVKVLQKDSVKEPVSVDDGANSSASMPSSETSHRQETEDVSKEENVSEAGDVSEQGQDEKRDEDNFGNTEERSKDLKEINDTNKVEQLSWNDLLKRNDEELGSHLGKSPVKKLSQAIGINDKFSFINDLFREDQTLYNRSLKTIDKCRNIDEAMYWINRELKIKLGWQDNNPTVQSFYQLVRKRFS